MYCVVLFFTVPGIIRALLETAPRPPSEPSPAGAFLMLIWTTLFYAAIWMGQNWARYLLVASRAFFMVVTLILIFGMMQYDHLFLAFAFAILLLLMIVEVAVLIYSPSIRALVRR